MKQKLTEMAYERQDLQKKMTHIQKCINEVDNALSGKKKYENEKKHRPRAHFVFENSAFVNAPSPPRTLDTLIKSQVLFQLS